MTFDLILIGFGNVAKRFVSLLQDHRARLAREFGIRTRIVGLATKRHGQVFSPRGIAPSRAGPRFSGAGVSTATPAIDFLRDALERSAAAGRERRLVVVETTTLDIERGQPAIDHVLAALAGGAHVVTTNKGPAAFAYRDLAHAAARSDRQFLFEGAVMDGIPIFNLVRETMPAVNIIGFRGVVNSTTNCILTAMEQGQSFAEALADMQAAGIAEADPSLDVEGWDAAAKAAALANVLLGGHVTPRTVERQGITPDAGRQAIAARTVGRRLKLVVRAAREDSRVTARVALEELPDDDLLAGLEGQQNAIIFHTDLIGEIAIVQRGGGLTQTAYALLSDLVTIARATLQSRPSAPSRRSR